MTGRGKKAAAPKKKANGYKMPAPIPNGEVIHDTIMKKKWRIGPSIGVGGFGEIYSACDHESSPKKGSNYPYVVKIEPHENGPLFVEKHFYVRNANKDDIAKFAKTKNLSSIGMPTYYGNGSHNYNGEKYRYLVLERYGKDLWSQFESSGKSFPAGTVFQIGLQILDVLEYIHSRGYVHADIKAANILLGLKKGTENQAYLVDFGLATRVSEKEFKPDPKCAHNGTIEYTSRDAHQGVSTMRGDLEILGYNMVHWLAGSLPWEKCLAAPKSVQELKEGFMRDARGAVARLAGVPEPLIKFFEYINTLKPKDTPDYTKCRNLFEGYLKTEGRTRNSKLVFTTTKKAKASKQTVSQSESEEDVKPKATKKKAATENGVTKKVVQRAAKEKVKVPGKVVKESDSETENSENERPNSSVDKVVKKKVVRKAKLAKVVKESDSETENCENETPNSSVDDKVVKKKVVRKAKPAKVVKDSETENCEDKTPNSSVDSKVVKNKVVKRKSIEPAFVVKIKKARVSKATPPVRKNHVNMATQTSGQKRKSPRQVSFDSPICAIIAGKKPRSANSSADIFEDSFEIEEKKVKPKKRLLRDVEETVERVVRKKVSTVKPKAKSWKDAPSVVNGRSPPS